MGKFFYRARNRAGSPVTGFLEAPEQSAVAAALRRNNYAIVEIRPAPEKDYFAFFRQLSGPKAGEKELALFCRQLATMLGAGIALLPALDVLRRQTENKKLRQTLLQVTERLRSGSTFQEAAQMSPDIFSPIFVNMLGVGELGGVLEQVLHDLATHFEKEHDLKEKIKSALIYPAIVLALAVLTVVFFLSFVLPNFVLVLNQLQAELPAPTRLLLKAGEIFRGRWYLFGGGAFFGGCFAWWGSRRRWGSAGLARAALKIPFFGGLLHKTGIARFCRTLAMLTGSGVPLLRALEAVQKATGNGRLNRTVDEIVANVREGRSITGPLARSGVFPPLVVSLAAVGEETGKLDVLLEKAAAFYEREVNEAAGRLTAVIEPALIVGVGLVVGFVVLSIFLPLLQIVGQAGG